ncbi:MAG: response regulator [Archangiaceae bacterium]|nr:response regulator [Archangiaceae bacterium]
MALLLGICATFIQLYFPTSFRAQADVAFTERAQSLARLTGSTLGPTLDFDDRTAAARRLAELASVNDAVAAVLFDSEGQRFARWDRDVSHTPDISAGLFEGFTASRDFYVARTPIPARAVSGGELVVLLSTHALAAQEAQAHRAVWLATIAMLALGLLAALLLGSVLLKPISRVTATARRISAGDVNAGRELALDRTDEVGVMARALHDMVDRLLEQRALLHSQSESSSEGILVATTEGKVLAHNRRFRELWGITSPDLAERSLSDVLTTLRGQLSEPVPLLEGGDDVAGPVETPPFELHDGRVLTAYRAPILVSDGKPFALAWYFRDVTALASAQEQLVVADRRSSVGQLAAGVAHEVNNPLSFIIGNLQFCLEEVEKLGLPERSTAAFTEALADCQTGAQRVAYIVRSLTALSRGDDGERAQIDVIDCLQSTLTIAAPELKHRARVETRFSLEKPFVDANAVRLGQVFLNLLINAAKALPDRPENLITVAVGAGPDHTVEIAITDTGCGMSDAVKAKLFQPFFTTRGVGSGTGLGLSISRSIVESYGGTIRVDSERGKGSTVTARRPLRREVAAPAGKKRDVEVAAVRRLKLMVVDDEPQVAAAVRRSVSTSHDVTVFARAEDALATITRGERFDAVITDLHMPGMTGAELYLQLKKLAPQLAAHTLFISGGAVTDEMRRFIADNPQRLFPKPFDAQVLRSALADLSREGA